jgi:hypothetical protein
MPFEVGETINTLADKFQTLPMVNTIVKNPIYTAMLITFIVILITLFIFRDVDSDESLIIMGLRSGFWIFMLTTGVLFLHNKALTQENMTNEKVAAYENIFAGSAERSFSTLEDSVVPVNINTNFS